MVNVTPDNCIVGCCFPMTHDAFVRDLYDKRKDFIPNTVKIKCLSESENWTRYKKQIIDPYLTLERHYKQFGFRFVNPFAFEDFKRQIENSISHIIIWGHCNYSIGTIEFSDRLIYPDDFINAIPERASFFLDLSVCKPDMLVNRLKVEREMLRVKSVAKPIIVSLWYYYYAELFETIINYSVNYIKAYDITIDRLRNQKDKMKIL